jgi:uncharacterized protein
MRVVVSLVVAAITLVLLSARGVAGLYTDYLWFDSLRASSVWSHLLGAKVGLALVFTAVFFVLLFGNLLIAQRLAPAFRRPGPEEQTLAPFRALTESRPRALWAAVSLFLATMFGFGVAGQWREWILFRNSVSFGVQDPLFDRDIGFYVFQLPFLSFLIDWLFGALLVVLMVTAVAHYLNGGIRFQVPPPRVTPGVKAHLSVLAGLIALTKAANYLVDRYELLYSTRGAVQGATYTDVNAQLPAFNLLIVISVVAAALFLVNIRQQGWMLPLTAVGLWFLVAVVAGSVYPALVQRFRVEPAESTREVQYIARNIEATKAALGLGNVQVKQFAYDEELSPEALVRNAETIRNVRLWDPSVLQQTYQRLQEVRTFYRFTDVDVDRYQIGGDLTQIVLSARELNAASLPSDTWENRHLAFTHGYGAVLSPANAVTADGQPDFLVRNIPPQGEPAISQPRLYHGEAIGGFAIVNTGRDEIDYVRDDGTPVTNRYDGEGGVGIGSLTRRVAFALRFGDINPVISGFMRPESRILYIRDIRERVQTIAPFLEYDADPYPVVLDGRITWLLDAYTTTDRYPYAQHADVSRVSGASGLRQELNYVRNSVKVAIDAYDGTVTFYIVDPDDPIAAAYAKAFPRLFSDVAEAPAELRAHFRFPEDLFRVQTSMWGRYHISDPNEFYSQSDRWNVAQDPGQGTGLTAPVIDPTTGQPVASAAGRMDPYYLLMRLPGERTGEFLILQPFVPFSPDDTRRELSAFMVAKADPDEYGKLEVFVMPRDRQVDGPAIVNARINQDPEISQLITLLSRAGSEVLLGNLVLIPVEQSLIYIRPLYVQATGANAVPELKKVIVAFGDRIALRDTLQDALVAVFGDAPRTLEEGPGTTPVDPATPGTPVLADEARRFLEEAGRAFTEADAALRNGDPVTYATKIQDARRAFDRAREAAARVTAPAVQP